MKTTTINQLILVRKVSSFCFVTALVLFSVVGYGQKKTDDKSEVSEHSRALTAEEVALKKSSKNNTSYETFDYNSLDVPEWAKEELRSWLNDLHEISFSDKNENESWEDNTGLYSLHHPNRWSKMGIYSGFKPYDEDFSKRSENTKTFRNPDGSFTAFFLSGLHYKDGAGNWRDIDLSLSNNLSGKHTDYDIANITNVFKTFFSSNPKNGFLIEKDNHSIALGKNP